jgi:hypothetical protein
MAGIKKDIELERRHGPAIGVTLDALSDGR